MRLCQMVMRDHLSGMVDAVSTGSDPADVCQELEVCK